MHYINDSITSIRTLLSEKPRQCSNCGPNLLDAHASHAYACGCPWQQMINIPELIHVLPLYCTVHRPFYSLAEQHQYPHMTAVPNNVIILL